MDEHRHTDDKIMELLLTHNRVIFGDEQTGDLGMKQKIDEIYKLLTQARNVGGFFNGIGGTLKWILTIAAIIVVAKGWFTAFVSQVAIAITKS